MFYELIREKVTESVTFQITVTSVEFDHYERGKKNIKIVVFPKVRLQ